MSTQSSSAIDLTVRSFAYVAAKMAHSSDYARILREAEKHRCALLLLQKDMMETTRLEWRRRTMTEEQYRQLHDSVTQTFTQAQNAIARIAAKYAPQRLAA